MFIGIATQGTNQPKLVLWIKNLGSVALTTSFLRVWKGALQEDAHILEPVAEMYRY